MRPPISHADADNRVCQSLVFAKTTNEDFAGYVLKKALEYNSPDEAPVNDGNLNSAETERCKRLKTLEWSFYVVGNVGLTAMCVAIWNPGTHWSRSSRHSLMVCSWLVFAAFGLLRLILMRRRSKMAPGHPEHQMSNPTSAR